MRRRLPILLRLLLGCRPRSRAFARVAQVDDLVEGSCSLKIREGGKHGVYVEGLKFTPCTVRDTLGQSVAVTNVAVVSQL